MTLTPCPDCGEETRFELVDDKYYQCPRCRRQISEVTESIYITGKIPKLKRMARDSINKMKMLQYLCEENINLLTELQDEIDKL